MRLNRDFYRPSSEHYDNVRLRTYEDLPGTEIYTYESGGRIIAKAFGGRRSKPDWFYRFPNEDYREKRISEYLEAQREAAAYKAERRGKKAAPHGFLPGQLFYISWGYNQTNVDFYMLTELKGNTMGRIVPIGQKTVRTATGADYVSPDPDCVLDYDTLLNIGPNNDGSEAWKRLNKDGFSIDGRYFASPCDADTERYQTAAGYGH